MSQMILITGGARSGKSAYAQQLAESLPEPRVFIATCPALDDEMKARIRKHQEARQSKLWRTLEEPVDLRAAVRGADDGFTLLVDCLTLWVNNLLYEAQQQGRPFSEADMTRQCQALLEAGRQRRGRILFVTNEVGMGIVPENPLARLFRDLAGRCNREMAQACDRVVFLVSGQPLELKRKKLEVGS